MSTTLTQDQLDKIFPSDRADAFFDALFGGAEDGAYDIRLTCVNTKPDGATFNFELHQRPGKCLVCNLTHGLPQVFERHPVLNVKGAVADIAKLLGWDPDKVAWSLGRTEEHSHEMHCIPLFMSYQG